MIKDADLSKDKAESGTVHEENACDEGFSVFYYAYLFEKGSHIGTWVGHTDIGQDKKEFWIMLQCNKKTMLSWLMSEVK